MQKSNNSKIKILLTGGHAGATAYAVIQEIKKSHANWILYWVGATSAIEGKHIDTLERKVFPELGVKYLPLVMGRLQRKFTVWTIPSILKTPIGFIHATIYLLYHRPNVIVSFGGFVGFPVVFIGWLIGIPVILHEQTLSAGLANKMSSPFAKLILLANEKSDSHFPKHKTRVVGNPIAKEFSKIKRKNILPSRPTILITGGSRGSEIINKMVGTILSELLEHYTIIHQTGEHQLKEFLNEKGMLLKDLRKYYDVYPTISSSNWYKFIKKSDIIISRSGANIVSEIIAAERPSVLIPIPFSTFNEQLENAKRAEKAGIAVILEQDRLTPETLLNSVNKVRDNWESMVRISGKASELDKHASKKVVAEIEKVVK